MTARFYDHRIWMLGVGWFSLLVTVLLFSQIPGAFQPTIDDENSRVEIEMVPGTTLATTKGVSDRVDAILRAQPDVERTMQHLAENTMAHNAGIQILKNQFDLLKTAIRGRV